MGKGFDVLAIRFGGALVVPLSDLTRKVEDWTTVHRLA
jgi:hypothetical protein